MLIRALCESVRLKASTLSLRRSAWSNNGLRLVPLGGFSSAVTTNFRDAKTSANERALIYASDKTDYVDNADNGVGAGSPVDVSARPGALTLK